MTATTRNIIEELRRAATEQGAGEAVRTIAGPALETRRPSSTWPPGPTRPTTRRC